MERDIEDRILIEEIHSLEDSIGKLESQLQQSHDMNAALREALEVAGKALTYAGVGEEYPFERLRHVVEAHRSTIKGDADFRYWTYVMEKMDEALKAINQALSSPSQSSRYREMEAVVRAAKNLIFALVTVGSDEVTDFHINKTRDAIAAHEQAAQANGGTVKQLCEDQQGDECTVHDVCAVTGRRTCCLTCGNSKNCEKRCEYVGQVPVND